MKQIFSRLMPFFAAFLLIEAALRTAFGIRELANLDHSYLSILHSIGLGIVMDMATFAYILPLILLVQICIPARLYGSRLDRLINAGLFFIFLLVMCFACIAEWLFWDEFASRFNFIAVDYLIYMDEVTGNIFESYPVVPLFLAITFIAAIGAYGLYSWQSSHTLSGARRPAKLASVFAAIAIIIVSFFSVSINSSERNHNRYEDEITKNGIFSLFSAFRNNELNYADFYLTDDKNKALADLRQHLKKDGYPFVDDALTRRIKAAGPEIHPNIVLITVESLSAEYLGIFGNKQNLTPNIDKLSKDSLLFTDLYASGTRTVYGLSAITLSIPPVPGNAIARRPENSHLFSLGALLNERGYESRFIYGGYGYFDNMNTFFGGNGYRNIDRSSLKSDEIKFANIWGVCDGDVFDHTLLENDASFKKGQPFFDMIMTTSNHQPFTYPNGKIDIPSPGGRMGGVKYTDYAIGKFIEDARKRPWFDNTIFVIVADHTAGSSGKLDLTPDKHHIPMMFYAPKLIKPQIVSGLASQIDLAPTLLGLMNVSYDSRFYGRNMLKDGEPRAFIANYQYMGLLKPGALIVLKPGKKSTMYREEGNIYQRSKTVDADLLSEAVAYYQNAAQWKKYNQAIAPGESAK